MLFAGVFLPHPFICISDASAVPDAPGTPHQHPGALGASKALALEQIPVTVTVAGFVSTRPEPPTSWQRSWSRTLRGEPWHGSTAADGAGQPRLSITIPRAGGDVRQPCKPVVILKCFDNVPLGFNVTYPCVCTSVIERDIGQI